MRPPNQLQKQLTRGLFTVCRLRPFDLSTSRLKLCIPLEGALDEMRIVRTRETHSSTECEAGEGCAF